LKVFENRVLRRIFGPKREEVAGGWRELHNVELYNLYASPNVITVIKSRWMRLTGNIARTERIRNAYDILVKEPEGKKPFGRPKSRCEDNIGMNLREMWWKDVNRMHMAQDRDQWRALVNTITNPRVS